MLNYHHIPDHIKFVIKNLYTDFKTSIITSQFQTPFLTIGRDVLQGDCLSPLLFNMCFNTFIQHIKAEKYSQFGFSFKMLNPIHWFQFADDAAVITSQESESQHLLNCFSVWCQSRASILGGMGGTRPLHFLDRGDEYLIIPPLFDMFNEFLFS